MQFCKFSVFCTYCWKCENWQQRLPQPHIEVLDHTSYSLINLYLNFLRRGKASWTYPVSLLTCPGLYIMEGFFYLECCQRRLSFVCPGPKVKKRKIFTPDSDGEIQYFLATTHFLEINYQLQLMNLQKFEIRNSPNLNTVSHQQVNEKSTKR